MSAAAESDMVAEPIFGRVLTAMVTPFDPEGNVDLPRARELARRLVDEQGNDALVVNGTTGESPTTSDDEKAEIVAAVVAEVGERAQVIAGVGTNDTRHCTHIAQMAVDAGAHALLVVTPYYSRPPQRGILRHFLTLADALPLPIMAYDIPHRAGVPIEPETLLAMSKHPNVVAVKDAKGDLGSSSRVIAESTLTYYAGDDALTLPMLSIGGAGVVGTSTHFTGRRTREMIDAFLAGRLDESLALHQSLLPLYSGVFATQGVMLVKAGLAHQGFEVGGVRLPLPEPTEAEVAAFAALLDAADL